MNWRPTWYDGLAILFVAGMGMLPIFPRWVEHVVLGLCGLQAANATYLRYLEQKLERLKGQPRPEGER